MTGRQARPVRVRLSGDRDDIQAVAGALAQIGGLDVISESAPRRNLRDPGDRVYLTVLVRPVAGSPATGGEQ
ncbi:MAG: hypothetical protein ACYCO9_06375 [Streptosporangiaceae bacterium]